MKINEILQKLSHVISFRIGRNERVTFCVKTHKESLMVLNMQRNADMQGNQGTKALSGLGVHFPAGPTGILFCFCF